MNIISVEMAIQIHLKNDGAMNVKTRRLMCYGCGKSGHIKAKCRFKKKNKVERIVPNNKKNSVNEASNETQLKQSTMVAYSDEEATDEECVR